MTHSLEPHLASAFARIALGHVTREYPHKGDHVMAGDMDAYIPRQVHPIFYGSFDWHSCVHGFWLLARIRRLFPDLPETRAIDAHFAETIREEKIAVERAYLARPWARVFERPYGWAWLLMLAGELELGRSPFAAALRPLAFDFRNALLAYLPALTYPVRSGSHANTAFTLVLAVRYARTFGDAALLDLLTRRAIDWFERDRVAQTWEPGGEDFLSPVLMEALAMAEIMPAAHFGDWMARYLPHLADGQPAELFIPASVSDRSDGRIAHLDGLNLSRAWAMRGIVAKLTCRPSRRVLAESADHHLGSSMAHVAGDYMGEHWLASFALLALTDASPT